MDPFRIGIPVNLDRTMVRKPLLGPFTWVVLSLVLLLLWAYWPSLSAMARKWMHDPQYSHGFLVPLFSIFLLWKRRSLHKVKQWQWNAWGLAFLVAGLIIRVVSVSVYFDWLDGLSLLVSLAGLCLVVGGWTALRWAWPSIAFLIFMVPLPYRVDRLLAQPLQNMATIGSTYVLQTLGLGAVAEGNTIVMDGGRIGIVSACNGLSMVFLFIALSVAVAILVHRPRLDKVLILASAIPIALVANIGRIVTTGVVQEVVGVKATERFFHDAAGWMMMPFALAMVGLELWLLSRLFGEVDPKRPLMVAVSQGRFPVGSASRKKSRGLIRPEKWSPPTLCQL